MSVGIRDVARAAGVSTATVSRALGRGPVSEALKAQVEAAVRATGYRPNLSARRLRSQATQTVGLLVPDIRNPFFAGVGRAVEDAAYAAGMRVILCNTDEDPEREAMGLRLMEEERVTGVICAPTRATAEALSRHPLACPTVFVDRAGPPGSPDSVVLDNAAASAALVEHLVGEGYRRIGGLFSATQTSRERLAGYEAAMARLGLPAQGRRVAQDSDAAEAAARAWLASGRTSAERPEALILANGPLLMGALRAARGLDLAVPGALALAGFDNEPWTEFAGPGVTVIEQPAAEIGAQAMELLFARLKEPDQPVRKVVLAGRPILRGSSRRPD